MVALFELIAAARGAQVDPKHTASPAPTSLVMWLSLAGAGHLSSRQPVAVRLEGASDAVERVRPSLQLSGRPAITGSL